MDGAWSKTARRAGAAEKVVKPTDGQRRPMSAAARKAVSQRIKKRRQNLSQLVGGALRAWKWARQGVRRKRRAMQRMWKQVAARATCSTTDVEAHGAADVDASPTPCPAGSVADWCGCPREPLVQPRGRATHVPGLWEDADQAPRCAAVAVSRQRPAGGLHQQLYIVRPCVCESDAHSGIAGQAL